MSREADSEWAIDSLTFKRLPSLIAHVSKT